MTEKEEEFNIDTVTDDELDSIIDQAANEEFTSDSEDTNQDSPEDENEPDDTETNEDDVDQPDDTDDSDEDDSDEDEEDNTHDADDNTDEADASDADSDDTTEQKEPEDKEVKDDEPKTTESTEPDPVDYKAFYEQVTGEFTANGKKIKGFKDPKKLIQAQQMALGLSEKMRGFKQYRPMIKMLEKYELLDEQELSRLIDIREGNVDAIKSLIQDKGIEIDSLESDEDDAPINYTPEYKGVSQAEIVLDDTVEVARNAGVESRFTEVMSKSWSEDGSLGALLEDPQEAQTLVQHLVPDENGVSVYDEVMQRVQEKAATDLSGGFIAKTTYEQYKEAAGELSAEYEARQKAKSVDDVADRVLKIQQEKDRILKERQAAEYKAKAEQEVEKQNKAREKATSLSKPKHKAKPKTKKPFDPLALNDDEIDDFLMQITS